MGRFKDGILGGFSGKVGSVVGYQRKGQNYMRSLPKLRTSKKISEAEQANRKKFAEAQEWLKELKYYVRIGFKNYRPTFEGFVAAKSYLLKNAIKGTYPDITVDPSLVLVSSGDLPGCIEPRAECKEQGKIHFYWKTKEYSDLVLRYDLVMVLAYDTVNLKAEFDIAAAKRDDGEAVLNIGGGLEEVHVYISFTSTDRERISNSQYLGKLKLL